MLVQVTCDSICLQRISSSIVGYLEPILNLGNDNTESLLKGYLSILVQRGRVLRFKIIVFDNTV